MSDRRVLVTGATGFIGRRTLEPLVERGFEVHAVARSAPEGGPGPIIWHRAELLDRDEQRAVVEAVGASHLLHLAWYAVHSRFWTAPENVRWVGATAELVQAFAEAGGTRAVLAGSCAEYDWEADGVCIEGQTPLRPATLYGVCKDAARRVTEALGPRLEIELAWGRVFFLYGSDEDERRLVASVARALLAGERAATREGSQVRDFLHVNDVAAAFGALVDSPGVQGAVNIGAGQRVRVREIVEQVARAVGREDLLDVGSLPSRPGEPQLLVPDVQRLRTEVGFAPALTLEQGLRRTVEELRRAKG